MPSTPTSASSSRPPTRPTRRIRPGWSCPTRSRRPTRRSATWKKADDLAKAKAKLTEAWKGTSRPPNEKLKKLEQLGGPAFDGLSDEIGNLDKAFAKNVAEAADKPKAEQADTEARDELGKIGTRLDEAIKAREKLNKELGEKLVKARQRATEVLGELTSNKKIPKPYKKAMIAKIPGLRAMFDTQNPDALALGIKAVEEFDRQMKNDVDMDHEFVYIKELLAKIKTSLDDENLKKGKPNERKTIKTDFEAMEKEILAVCDQTSLDRIKKFEDRVNVAIGDSVLIVDARKQLEPIIKEIKGEFEFVDKQLKKGTKGEFKKYGGALRQKYYKSKYDRKSEDLATVGTAATTLEEVAADLKTLHNMKGPERTKAIVDENQTAVDSKAKAKDDKAKDKQAWRDRFSTFQADLRQLRLVVAKVDGDMEEVKAIEELGHKAEKTFGTKDGLAAATAQLQAASARLRRLTASLLGDKETSRKMVATLGPRWTTESSGFRGQLTNLTNTLSGKTAGTDYETGWKGPGESAVKKVAERFSPAVDHQFDAALAVLGDEDSAEKDRLKAREEAQALARGMPPRIHRQEPAAPPPGRRPLREGLLQPGPGPQGPPADPVRRRPLRLIAPAGRPPEPDRRALEHPRNRTCPCPRPSRRTRPSGSTSSSRGRPPWPRRPTSGRSRTSCKHRRSGRGSAPRSRRTRRRSAPGWTSS